MTPEFDSGSVTKNITGSDEMSLRHKLAAIVLMAMMAMLGTAAVADAGTVVGVYAFQNTGATPPSNYGNGRNPQSELLQASDGNFYGTAEFGGAGLCGQSQNPPATGGCGTIFRVSAVTGALTTLFSFPSINNTAPDGAYPTAGLIQGKDGALYGVARDGGINGQCFGTYGCGTLFRITTTGVFTLLHQFCGGTGCPGIVEGGAPISHLVQTADGTLYGITAAGGYTNLGTLFSATISGAVKTLHYFQYIGGDGVEPYAPLLVGHDGKTLYGTTPLGGANNRGTVFSYDAAGLTIIYSFDNPATDGPYGALIYGADGLLYGTTSEGADGPTVYSLSTTGSGFATDATTIYSGYSNSGLLLGSDGMMYGAIGEADRDNEYGGLFVYNPSTKAIRAFVAFQPATGAEPLGAPIEGKDHYLYGTNSIFGGSDSRGVDGGTLYRIGPPLSP